jgi:hypothetical protein
MAQTLAGNALPLTEKTDNLDQNQDAAIHCMIASVNPKADIDIG